MIKRTIFASIMLMMGLGIQAQMSIADELQADVKRAAGMHYALTISEPPEDTPPPGGKRPFYINHYGCPSAYYLERPDYYDDPYFTLSRADSLGKLTELGHDVLKRVAELRRDSHNKTGELTEEGKQQARDLAKLLAKRLPEVFSDDCVLDGRSIVQNHSILTLGETALQLSMAHQPMRLSINSSHSFQAWLNPQDKVLEKLREDSLTMARYEEFTTRWAVDYSRLMTILFNDPDYVKTIDAKALNTQLFDLACSPQYSEIPSKTSLYNIFTPDEIHRHWLRRNAWAYIRYGGCTLNGGYQHFLQRKPLWNLIHIGDSILTLDYPVVHLRYTQEHVVMSLVCLLELDGFGLQTDCLDSLETKGWADYRIAPLGGSVILIYYRTDKDDTDPLIRVLLNGHEARLPITTDCAPYYHLEDVKRYYLRKLYVYARERDDE